MKKAIISLSLACLILSSLILPARAYGAPVLQTEHLGSSEIRYFYNEQGLCVMKDSVTGGTGEEYIYNSAGRHIQTNFTENGTLTGRTYYDAHGNETEVWELGKSNQLEQRTQSTLTYDSFGRLTGRQTLETATGCIYSERYEYYNDLKEITFGHYEQDAHPENGLEPIEWIVLDVQEDKLLLISKYALDCQYYYETDFHVSWQTSDLRGWLNANFLYDAFTPYEQNLISPVILEPGAGEDWLFLLSLEEAEQYFPGKEERICQATDYAVSRNAYVNKKTGGSWWLLRTAGETDTRVMSVNSDGTIDRKGGMVSSDRGTVRPAMWVPIDIPQIGTESTSRKTENHYFMDEETGMPVYGYSVMETFDEEGRLYYRQDAMLNQFWEYDYDDRGNLTQAKWYLDTSEVQTDTYKNTYDSKGRLTSVKIQYRHEASGSGKTLVTTEKAQLRYRYDGKGRLTWQKEEDRYGDVTTQTWKYDKEGRIQKYTCECDNYTQTDTWQYTDEGSICTRVKEFAAGSRTTETEEYDDRGNLRRVIYNGNILEEYIYVPLSQALWK